MWNINKQAAMQAKAEILADKTSYA